MERTLGYWLNTIQGIGYKKIDDLLNEFVSYENVYRAKEIELSKIKSLTKKNILDILNSKNIDKIKERMDFYEGKGYSFVLRYDINYPKKLKDIYNPPHILFYRGNLPKDDIPSIAIVGARECSNYGLYYANKLAYDLANHGIQVISGMARGIDAAAHKGALFAKKGRTYGILGCGIDMCYPKENIDVYMGAIETGGIISEYPMYTNPKAGNFPMRNRIISGLCDGLLVVEARKKSGSLITVDLALEQGKDIYTIPGGIDSVLSEGCNNLIKMGAKVVTDCNDILEDFSAYIYSRNTVKNDYKCSHNIDKEINKNKIFLETQEKIVYASLRLESKHIDEIVSDTGLSLSEVIKILFDLEEKNLVIQRQNNYYARLNLG